MTSPAVAGERTAAPRARKRRDDRIAAAVLLAPSFAGFLVFYVYPALRGMWYSFTDFSMLKPPNFVGLDNYSDLFADDQFRTAAGNTAIFALVTMIIGPLLGLVSALLLNRARVGQALFRAAFFLPVTMSLVVVSTMWKMLLNDDGLINRAIEFFGGEGHQWLSDPDTALLAVCAASIWQGFGFETIILLAALQGIPRERYEAAAVDGAGPWRTFRAVTLPALRPALLFVYVVGIIGAFQVYDQVYVMTRGGPADSTMTVVYYLVEKFHRLDLGHASAAAYLLVIFLAAASALQMRLERRPS